MNEWIRVEEQLPKDINHVLCCTVTKAGRKNVIIGYWDPDDERWCCGMNTNVRWWMPLPEPPKEEDA